MIAMLLNMKIKGMSLFRTMFYLPSVITGVAVSVVWMWLLQPDFGLLNYFLRLIGIKGPDWLGDTTWMLFSMVMIAVWSTSGTQVVIYLAGLQNVPPELYEAASIDGAGRWNRFINVTIPMLTPTIFFNLVMGIIGAFRTFTQAYVITRGKPPNALMFYAIYLYQKAFRDVQLGYASALSWILFVIIAFFTLLVFRSSSAWVYYESERK
jgi:multiple sugar transport system permease protein